MPPNTLSIGDRVSQDEIEETFDTGFGYRISGINPRRDHKDRRYVLVFANEDGPYDDSVTQGKFEYIGEGLSGDQSENSPGNSTLIDAIGGGFPVYFFFKSENDSRWEYQGLVDVLDYRTEERDGRDVLVFTMEHRRQEPNDNHRGDTPHGSESEPDEETDDNEPELTEDTEQFTETRRRARDTEFARKVRKRYNETCVICGSSRETPDGRPEVEAAHIYPRGEGGTDDVRNGIALCRLHHWAFDTGWIAVSDDYTIRVKDAPERDGYHEFKQLEGKPLTLPENGDVAPHPTYLREHQKINNF